MGTSENSWVGMASACYSDPTHWSARNTASVELLTHEANYKTRLSHLCGVVIVFRDIIIAPLTW